MFKYEVVINWSEPDASYIANVPELPGCVAHGQSAIDALKNVEDAIALWIQVAEEFGDPIPVPKNRRAMPA